MRTFLQKLKSNKGATGADVVVALSVIVVGMAVVSVIYISLSNGGKRVTRTSGATRIAVNIMENIERLDYTRFEYEIGKLKYPFITNVSGTAQEQLSQIKYNLSDVILQLKNDATDVNKQNTIEITRNNKVITARSLKPGKTRGEFTDENYDITWDDRTYNEVFGTKIPNGYDFKITVISSPYGKSPYELDFAARISVTVSFKVDDREESVTLQTVKRRELLEECNPPDLSGLTANAFPIMENPNSPGNYIKCSTNSSEWYNYSNRKWAMVYDCGNATKNAEKAALEGNIVFSGTGNDTKATGIKVWIPRYGYISESEGGVMRFYFFAYKKTVYPIYQLEIPSLLNGSSKELLVNCPMTFNKEDATISSLFKLTEGAFPIDADGVWVKYGKLTTNALSKDLLESQYGFKP